MRARVRDSLETGKKGTDIFFFFFLPRDKPSQRSETPGLRRASAVISCCFSTHSTPTPKTFPLGSFDSHSAGWDECWVPLKFQWQETFPSVRPQLPLMITVAFWNACIGEASWINKPNWEENPPIFRTLLFGVEERDTMRDWTWDGERERRQRGRESVRGKPYWSGGLINHQMPLTEPLIFCDQWQSGTAQGEMVGRE